MIYPKSTAMKISMPSNPTECSIVTKLNLNDIIPIVNQSGSTLKLNETALNCIIDHPLLESKAFKCNQSENPDLTKTADISNEIDFQSDPNSTHYSSPVKNRGLDLGKRVIQFMNLVPETVAQARKIDESFSSEAEDEKPLNYLKNLEMVLFKVFKGDVLLYEDVSMLKPAELQIYMEILLRKYKGSPNLRFMKKFNNDIPLDELITCTNSFIDEASTKRFEENVKFVFKLAFRRLKSNLLKQNRIAFYSKKFDIQFYEFYFKEVANRLNIDLKDFYDPFSTKGKAKTLSVDYLKLMFNSSTFKFDFIRLIDNEAVKLDYQNTLKRKIRQLLVKFDHYFGSTDEKVVQNGIDKAQNYFRKNRQCKLPWTSNEIITAVNTFEFMMKTV